MYESLLRLPTEKYKSGKEDRKQKSSPLDHLQVFLVKAFVISLGPGLVWSILITNTGQDEDMAINLAEATLVRLVLYPPLLEYQKIKLQIFQILDLSCTRLQFF